MSSSSATPDAQPPVDIDHELTSGFAARLIRSKAKQLVQKNGFSKSDLPDLQQEMKLRVWMRFAQFDPAKAHWNAFVTTVVERHVATLVQTQQRQKRSDETPASSLSEVVDVCDGVEIELGETIGPEQREALTGRYVENDESQVDLRLDVNALVATLPPDLQELCELLKFHDITSAAKVLKIPRTTASSMLMRIRSHFVEAEF